MGLISTKIYTSELILCSTIRVHSATRHNIHIHFRPLVEHWRSQGIPLVLFDARCLLDFSVAQNTVSNVRSDLTNADVVANEEKYIWVPTLILEWLNIVWDLSRGRIFIPQRRNDKLLKTLLSLQSGFLSVTPRAVAAITGQIISLTPRLRQHYTTYVQIPPIIRQTSQWLGLPFGV